MNLPCTLPAGNQPPSDSAVLAQLRRAVTSGDWWVVATDNPLAIRYLNGLAWALGLLGATPDDVLVVDLTHVFAATGRRSRVFICAIRKAFFGADQFAAFFDAAGWADVRPALADGRDLFPVSGDAHNVALVLDDLFSGRGRLVNPVAN